MTESAPKIRQAVIPAAGLGSRFLPVTKCMPKELIPLVDKPCLQHVVDEAIAAGVEEFIFVISREKKVIEDYFKPNDPLKAWMKERGQHEFAALLEKIETQARWRFVYQDQPLGLGHAVLCAKEAVTDDHFFVILPDDVIAATPHVCAQMLRVFRERKGSLLAVMPVSWEDVSRYGIVRAAPLSEDVGQIEDIVEKPRRENAPSNLAVIGRYILPKSIFPLLATTKPGAGGEIQLTDALRELVRGGSLFSFSFSGERHDTGTPLGWLKANVALALQHPQYREAMTAFIKLTSASC